MQQGLLCLLRACDLVFKAELEWIATFMVMAPQLGVGGAAGWLRLLDRWAGRGLRAQLRPAG